MELLDHQQAFSAWDKTSGPMRRAIKNWFALYYGKGDESQRIAYTVVNKLCRGVFAEYAATGQTPFENGVLSALNRVSREAVQLALAGGECYIKPCPDGERFLFTLVPRDQVLVFARDPSGVATDIGTAEKTTRGRFHYTLLERRKVDKNGYLTIENQLFRSLHESLLGQQVELSDHPLYENLAPRYTYQKAVGSVGLVQVKTPMVNCIDGSKEGVAVFAPAVELIRSIQENETQFTGEFSRGQSRILVSKDLLDEGQLKDNMFVGLDDDPDRVGIQIFSPSLRQESFIRRKQEYLRNVETVIGLKRGTLSDTNYNQRTATEIAASQTEQNLALMDFRRMWEQAVRDTLALCRILADLYGFDPGTPGNIAFDWGNGVLFDEDKTWADYMAMVSAGLIAPEVALGWRFDMPSETEEERAQIRKRLMP